MKKFLKNKKTLLAIFGIILLAAGFVFLFAGRILDYSQKPIRSDVLIVLGGGGEEREITAGRLFKSGFAKHVILSDGGSRFNPSLAYADQEKRWLLANGIPESAIIADRKSRNTYANAVIALQIMKQSHFRSAIVVSSTYHMRRAKYIFDKVFNGQRMTLRYNAADVPGYDPGTWWKTPGGRHIVSNEYMKFAFYISYYGCLKPIIDIFR